MTARDAPGPGRPIDDHDQPRRPVPRVPARRSDRAPADEGFFARDTRFVSGYDLFINGQRPVLLNAVADPVLLGPVRVHERRSSSIATASSTARASRSGSTGRCRGGVHEDLDIINYARRPVRLTIEIEIESDFADIFDVKAGAARAARRDQHPLVPLRARAANHLRQRRLPARAHRRRRSARTHRRSTPTAGFVFVALDRRRRASGTPACAGCRSPIRTRRPATLACNAVDGRHAETDAAAPPPRSALETPNAHRPAGVGPGPARHGGAPARGPDVREGRVHPGGRRAVVRDAVRARHAGRLDAGASAAIPSSPPARCAGCGALQATGDDPGARHGARQDPARDPPRRARPAADPAVPAVLRHARRDEPLRDRLLVPLPVARRRRGPRRATCRNAEAAMRWIDRFGDRDGDGFQEYETRSRHGYYNQGWKDAGDAIPHADGIAGAAAARHCASSRATSTTRSSGWPTSTSILGRHADARRACGARPKALYERFNEHVLVGGGGDLLPGPRRPQAADPNRSPPMPATCLQSGSSRRSARGRVVERLMAPRHVVGLGHPDAVLRPHRLQPVQLPHGHGLAARQRDDRRRLPALRLHTPRRPRSPRAVRRERAVQVAYRLPELFAGLPRDEASFPVQYLGANVPQAWAAGSILRLIAILCRIHATSDETARGSTSIPALPDWLPELTIREPPRRRGRCGPARSTARTLRSSATPPASRSSTARPRGRRPGRTGRPSGRRPRSVPAGDATRLHQVPSLAADRPQRCGSSAR